MYTERFQAAWPDHVGVTSVKDRVRVETDFIEQVYNIYNVCKTLSLRDKQVELLNKENYDINNDDIERHRLRHLHIGDVTIIL